MITAYVRIVFGLEDFPEKNKDAIIEYLIMFGNEKALKIVKEASKLEPISCVLHEANLENKIDLLLTLRKSIELSFELKIPK